MGQQSNFERVQNGLLHIRYVSCVAFFDTLLTCGLDRCINEYADSIWNIEPLVVKEESETRERTGLET